MSDVVPTTMETEKPVSAAANVEFPVFPGTDSSVQLWSIRVLLLTLHLIRKYLPGLITTFQHISEPTDADFDEDLPQKEKDYYKSKFPGKFYLFWFAGFFIFITNSRYTYKL